MSKRKVHIIFMRALSILAIGAVIWLQFGAQKAKVNRSCKALDIRVNAEEGSRFISDKDVEQLVRSTINKPVNNTSIEQFNLKRIEENLMANHWVGNVNMYFDNNEVLHIHLDQKEAIGRFFAVDGSSYYLDTALNRLPVSATARLDLPVFTSVPPNPSTQVLAGAKRISEAIIEDPFWKSQAAQIEILPGNNFRVYPTLGHHTVELGKPVNVADKLKNVKLFYKEVSRRVGFDTYKTINASYAGQIVAVRADSAAPFIDNNAAVKAFDQMVKANKSNSEEKKLLETRTETVKASVNRKVESKQAAKKPEEKPKAIMDKPVNQEPAKKAPEPKAPDNITKQPKAVMPKKVNN